MISLSNFLANVIVTSQASEFVQFRQKVEEKRREFQFWSALAVIRVEWRELVDPTHSHALTAHSPPFENLNVWHKIEPNNGSKRARWKPSGEFSSKPMNSCESGTRRQEFGAHYVYKWISLNSAQGIELWSLPNRIWLFFCDSNQSDFLSSAASKFSEDNFSNFYCFLLPRGIIGLWRMPQLFFSGKSHWFLATIISFVSTCGQNLGCFPPAKLVFYQRQTHVLRMPRAMFCPPASDNAAPFAFLSGSTPDKTCGGPLLLLPSARRICHLGHSSRSW